MHVAGQNLVGRGDLGTAVPDGLVSIDAVLVREGATRLSDAIAIVRRCLWIGCRFSTSGSNRDVVKVPHSLLEGLTGAVRYFDVVEGSPKQATVQ